MTLMEMLGRRQPPRSLADVFPSGARAQPYGSATYGEGNIDLNDRPIIHNPDGSYSTLYSGSFHDPVTGKEVLIPGVRRGLDRPMTMDEAITHYRQTGEHLGKFDTPEQADAYAERIHNEGQVGPDQDLSYLGGLLQPEAPSPYPMQLQEFIRRSRR
jgi:hypothetical protein